MDGEIYQLRSDAERRQFCVRVYLKEVVPDDALPSLTVIGNQLSDYGIRFVFEHSP